MRGAIFSSLSLLLLSCTLGAGNFAGKTCNNNNDCPEPYVCAQVRVVGRTCELVNGVDVPEVTGGGNYCGEVKKVLDRTCVSNCHGTDTSGSGLPLRFDVYTLGGDPPAAFEAHKQIAARVGAGTMPPRSAPEQLKPDERQLLIRWAAGGAPFCDGGMAETDAGTSDAGM